MHLVIDQEIETTVQIRLCPPCPKVLAITHEKANRDEMNDYFQKKFYPMTVVYMIGRSYKAEPQCKPDETLFDAWKELIHRRFLGLTASQSVGSQYLSDVVSVHVSATFEREY